MRLVALTFVACVAAVAGCAAPSRHAFGARVGGALRVVLDPADVRAYDAAVTPLLRAALLDRASRDLACPPADLAVRGDVACVAVVAGCGKSGVFARFERGASTKRAPGLEGESVMLTDVRFIPLDADLEAAKRDVAGDGPIDDEAPSLSVCGRDAPAGLAELSRINADGARDLDCPRGEVLPRVVVQGASRTGVADGCGKRATYLPGVGLSSVVAAPRE